MDPCPELWRFVSLSADIVATMAEPAYPSLDAEEGQGTKIGFEGLASGDQGGSFAVKFTPSGVDAKQQLTDEQQPSYRTFEGDQPPPPHASSEEINLLEKERPSSPSAEEKVRSRGQRRLLGSWRLHA